jgi:transcriptional regulator with XRE-family HTH domain
VKVPDDTVIGGRLRLARAETRITQADAAAALGIPRSAVSALEAGGRHLTAVELAKCSVLYRRPAGWFLGDDPGPAQPPTVLGRLIAALPRADQDTVTQFAEFLAARQATAVRAPNDAGGLGERAR